MKNTFIIVFFLCAAVFSAEEEKTDSLTPPAWILAKHELKTKESYEEINALLTQGYVPAGIEVNEETRKVIVLYILDVQAIKNKKWVFYQFERLDTFEAEFTAFLQKLWKPVDLAKTEEGIYVFFIKDETQKVESWRLNITKTAEELERVQAALEENGYHITGISNSEINEFWILSLKTASSVPKTTFYGYRDKEFDSAMNSALSGALRPESLMFIDEVTFIQFISLKE